jgi:hypothetical protein
VRERLEGLLADRRAGVAEVSRALHDRGVEGFREWRGDGE